MAEHAGKEVTIKISGTATSMTAEATSTADNQIYQITNAAKQVLDFDTPPTVLDDGVETEESYTVNYLSGKITFATVDAERGPVTVTGYYLPMSTAAYANDAGHSRVAEILDISAFGDTHKNKMAGVKSASGSLNNLSLTDTTYIDALAAGEPLVLEFVSASGGDPTRFRALLNSDEVKSAVNDLSAETIGWESKNEWLYLGE